MLFKTNSRIDCAGDRGTVKFYGRIDGLQGDWLGIDWDDETRGKHNGSLNGVSYFKTRLPNSGSFVRSSVKVDFGCSLMEGVHERYKKSDLDESLFSGHVLGTKEIEFVGMEKIGSRQSNLDTLVDVVLDDMRVSYSESNPGEIRNGLPSCRELDLTRNLLWNWTDVFNIIEQIPMLRFLNLSRNRLRKLDGSDSLCSSDADKIVTLLLNECNLSTDDVTHVFRLFPNIRELGLCRNYVEELIVPPGCLSRIRYIDLEDNKKVEWLSLPGLWSLPCLEVLNLTRTGLKRIDCGSYEGIFPALKTLYLSQNKISEWKSISQLNKLPVLGHLLVYGNPVYEMGNRDTNRQLVIAKIGKLKTLNREFIIASERRGAEIDYLKRFGPDWVAAERSSEPSKEEALKIFFAEHPRFLELIQKYGAPDEAELTAEMRPTGVLKNQLLHVTFVGEGIKDSARRIPSSMTVQKLKSLVGKLCRKNPRSLQLSYECRRRPGLFIPLDNDVRELVFYSVEDGDVIHVSANR